MTIPFNNIPQNLRVPLFYAEVDNSRANSGSFNQRALIIGQITAEGGAKPNVPILLPGGAGDAVPAGGAGSMLALMVAAYRQRDPFGEVWALPLADDAHAVAALGGLSFESAPVAHGVLSVYIGGARVAQPVRKAQQPAPIAQALAATINAMPHVPVTATAQDAQVKLTARNKGASGQ